MTDHRQVTTNRLDLRAVGADDLDDLYALQSDPATWTHAPDERHTHPDVTADWIRRAVERWARDGLSYWMARRAGTAAAIGVGGIQRQRTGNWNLFYRFTPSVWGQGFATELSRAAICAAHDVDDAAPVLAWILPHNDASLAVARRLRLIDHGVREDPSDGQRRTMFADRPLDT